MAAPIVKRILDSCVNLFAGIKSSTLEQDQQSFAVIITTQSPGNSEEDDVITDAVLIREDPVSSQCCRTIELQDGLTSHSILCASPAPVTPSDVKEIVARYTKELDRPYRGFYFWDVSDSEETVPSQERLSYCGEDVESIRPCKLEVVSQQEYTNQLLYLRLKGTISVHFTYISSDDFYNACETSFESLSDRLTSNQVAYRLTGSRLLFSTNDGRPSISGPSVRTLEDVHRLTQDEDDAPSKKKKHKGSEAKTEKVVDLRLLFKTGPPTKNENERYIVPTVQYETYDGKAQNVSMDLPLTVIVPLPSDSKVSVVPECLQRATLKQIEAMKRCLKDSFKAHGVKAMTTYFFKVPSHVHLISAVYPDGVSEGDLEPLRRELHNRLMLPTDRPYLRRLNRFVFPLERREVYLTNTHEGLPPSGVNGEVSLVQGTYSYHHYMQDKLNDNHWGCAYRSLQTLCSWFRHQGYTDVPVPTHKEIQQILVDVNDKPANFVGTKQWIGSVEVSTVLNQLLDVTSKILFVASGAELATKGRELAHHFKTQGTPVMSGGGARAHTILGVDFSSRTGDIKFLVLDPHYMGEEDVRVIQDKGWCAWQGPDFWDQTAYYNLCLPQRPVMI